MPKRREPLKPERATIRQPTPDERDERVVLPIDFKEAVKGLLAVDPDALSADGDNEA